MEKTTLKKVKEAVEKLVKKEDVKEDVKPEPTVDSDLPENKQRWVR